MQRHGMFIGAIMAACAVAMGALGAHQIESFLIDKHAIPTVAKAADPTDAQFASNSEKSISDTERLVQRRIGNWNTAATYQMYHALGIILVGVATLFRTNKSLQIAGWCFLIGAVLFSGSLYVLVLTEATFLGSVVPLGGVSFIVGWIAFAWGTCCMPTASSQTDPKLTKLS